VTKATLPRNVTLTRQELCNKNKHRRVSVTNVNTVTLEVASRKDVTRRALKAFKGGKLRARISFATPELLWKVLTAKRWSILKAMAGQGPLTIREVARRVERDVKAIRGDVHSLIDAGLRRGPKRTF